ncbi:hypothetical protein DFH09DRAFT_1329279 [Mycena vulgaris]|nr:hypothetical protein DFH09DRAFT_1329279 [Mycena vulgaris]
MDRATRTGRVFSPYVVDPSIFTNLAPSNIIYTDIDVGPHLQSAMANADRRAAALDCDELTGNESTDEWEDLNEELDSRPPSPLSDLTVSPSPTRAPSPVPVESAGPSDFSATHDHPQDELLDADDPHMPPLSIRAKHSQDHCQQPAERTAFDTASTYTSNAAHLDIHGRIIAILLGRPEDPDWDNVVRDAVKAMNRARRAGRKSVLSTGVLFGGGQKRPGNLVNSPKRQKIINYLLRNKSLRRLAGFQSSGFARFAPKLWRYYVNNLRLLFEHHDGLLHNFSNSIFPAVTFNLGPSVVTDGHFDFNNLMHGLCGVTSAGDFDHTIGGQIHLEQIKLVIDFPSGSGILIPSCLHRPWKYSNPGGGDTLLAHSVCGRGFIQVD